MMSELLKPVIKLMIAALLVVIILAPTLSYATNESSYKHGLSSGFNDYQCTVKPVQLYNQESDCGYPSSNFDIQTGHQTSGVTNITVCIDGYIQGWARWCKTDALTCAFDAAHNIFPSQLTVREKTMGALAWPSRSYQAAYQYGINDWNQHTNNKLNYECPLSHMKPYPSFCKGYDTALLYENSDQ